MAGFLAAAGLIGGAASAAGHGLADSHKRAGDVGGADVIFQTATANIRDAYFIHCHKGTIGAIRRVVEPLGYLINVTEWWENSDPPGTFRLDIGVLESGITEAMYQEMERLIADAKPASRHLIGLNITRDIPGYLFAGGVAYDGDVITVYPG